MDNVCECSRVRDEHIICEWVCVCVCVCSHSESLALIFAVFLLYYSFCSLDVLVARSYDSMCLRTMFFRYCSLDSIKTVSAFHPPTRLSAVYSCP